MFEKVNPSHPDKIADRIAGAIVDLAYSIIKDPKVAVEILIGHNKCYIITESNLVFNEQDIKNIVHRITKSYDINIIINQNTQDIYLASNQDGQIRCGDNGIFKGCKVTREQQMLTRLVSDIYDKYPYDGKYIINDQEIICCQSNCKSNELNKEFFEQYNKNYVVTINPLGEWTGGLDVDTGATNRKLGSDMGDSVTGGGLHGKDLSKADVSLNIYCFLKANNILENEDNYSISCAIGDELVDSKSYMEIVEIARKYINDIGGFEKFAEWGLIRP